MSTSTAADPIAAAPAGWWRGVAWQRIGFTLLVALFFALVFDRSRTPVLVWFMRTATLALLALLLFSVFEQWPRTLPRWLARWVLQLLGVVIAMPVGAVLAYGIRSGADMRAILGDPAQRAGFYGLLGPGVLFGPWIAFIALVRQRDALARRQALGFQLERSELERQAVDARMRLLQAQVQPHFLFNTLANVRALVKAGSPQAPAVLDSLIAYLRAAMPGLGDTDGSVARELALVRAYLDLMHLRMPDRLQFSVHADAEVLDLRCPPMALLTLVENAVRHGIDPAEEGGRIDVSVALRAGRCLVRVVDTGVGLEAGGEGTGTGLANLRERLRLVFGDAQLRLAASTPHGAVAELEFPAQKLTP